ncbi:hypothetical protein D6817_00600 [Candidatus Pacearchaeota archaeon]|nr:MAG: hypothetical protein D6817_00600 [Candidatus Pacearchaeota archaeon]
MPIKAKENLVGAWAFLFGLIFAAIGSLIGNTLLGPEARAIIQLSLIGIGFIVGFFVSERDAQTFLLAAVALVLVSYSGIQGGLLGAAVVKVSSNPVMQFVFSFLASLLLMFVPATIVVAIKAVFAISKR